MLLDPEGPFGLVLGFFLQQRTAKIDPLTGDPRRFMCEVQNFHFGGLSGPLKRRRQKGGVVFWGGGGFEMFLSGLLVFVLFCWFVSFLFCCFLVLVLDVATVQQLSLLRTRKRYKVFWKTPKKNIQLSKTFKN